METRLLNKRGFTIIELLVVVSIIGIIMSIASFNSSNVLEKSRDASLMINLTHLRNAVYQATLASNGKFPETLDALVPDFLNEMPKSWQGNKSSGKYGYDNETGKVSLLDSDTGNPSVDKDDKGREYGKY